MTDRSRTTKPPRGNRGPTPDGADHPDDGVKVVTAHWHGHVPDLHPNGGKAHWMDDNGHIQWGDWLRPGVDPWEHVAGNEHRHSGAAAGEHEQGDQAHVHDPITGKVITATWQPHDVSTDPPAEVEPGGTSTTTYNAEIEAPQARHPTGRDPYQQGFQAGEQATRQELANGDNTDPAAIQRSKEAARAANTRLDAVPTPQPPTPPALPGRSGSHTPGASIADPVAENTLNALKFHVADPTLQHEMNWHPILLRAVVQMTTYHADDRLGGGPGPELIPDDLLEAAQGALDQIVLPRRAAADAAREAQP